jgi:hypothetical protein
MAAGSVLAGRLGRRAGGRSSSLLFALLAPSAAAVAYSSSLGAACAGLFAAGLAATPLFVISEAALQERIAPDLRGRVFSIREILTRSLLLASSFTMSFLGRYAGKPLTLLLLGFFLAICGMIWVRFSGDAVPDEDR